MCIEPIFWIDWVSGRQRYRVFNYAEGIYAETSLAPGRASISTDGDGNLVFAIGGTTAMTVTPSGDVTFNLLTNKQAHLTGARLEFFRQQSNPVRLASLDSAGTFLVKDASEKTAVNDSSNDQFLLLDNAAITPGAILANHFIEGIP